MTPATSLRPAAVRQHSPLQLLRRYPLVSYFLIAYAFTWTFDLLFLVLFPLPDLPVGRTTPRTFGPSVAALVVTAALAGKPGLKHLLRRLVLWRVHPGWYLFALLGVPAIFTLGILLVPGAWASFTAPTPATVLLLPVLFLVGLVFGGPLGEEPGWRGFALPHLQERWGPVAGSVILGTLWAGWHATEYLTPDFAATNGGLSVEGVGVFALALISFSVIVTWVFNHTRASLLLAILLHASLNASQVLIRDLFPAAGTNERGPLVTFALAALVLVVATRGRLGYARADDGAGRVPGDEPAGASRAGLADGATAPGRTAG
jgi:membrane protease YdiL (CAAX protease family)